MSSILDHCKPPLIDGANDIMTWAASFRTEGLTPVMKAISAVGTENFLLGFIIIGLWFGNTHKYLKAALMLLVSMMINLHLKEIFTECRPTVVTHLEGAGGYSFPSGHGQLAGALFGYFLLMARQFWAKSALLMSMLAVAISRVYLGVHFLHDVAIGLVLGFAFAALVFATPWKKLFAQFNAVATGLIYVVLSISWAYYVDDIEGHVWKLAGMISSFGLGGSLLLADKRSQPRNQNLIRFVIGIVIGLIGVGVIWKGLVPLLAKIDLPLAIKEYSHYFLLGLWLVFVPTKLLAK